MKTVYHLDLNREKIQDAKIVLMPGNPFRSRIIAEMISRQYRAEHEHIVWNREFCTYLVKINGKKILVTSTGIGGPSTSIAIDELAQLGVTTFIRVRDHRGYTEIYRYRGCHYYVRFSSP